VADQTLINIAGSLLSSASSATVVYRPGSGPVRSIAAQVTYLLPDAMDGLAGGSRPQFDILVKNDSVMGISIRELDTAMDKISLPPRIGRASITVRIVEVIKQDRGMLLLRAW